MKSKDTYSQNRAPFVGFLLIRNNSTNSVIRKEDVRMFWFFFLVLDFPHAVFVLPVYFNSQYLHLPRNLFEKIVKAILVKQWLSVIWTLLALKNYWIEINLRFMTRLHAITCISYCNLLHYDWASVSQKAILNLGLLTRLKLRIHKISLAV